MLKFILKNFIGSTDPPWLGVTDLKNLVWRMLGVCVCVCVFNDMGFINISGDTRSTRISCKTSSGGLDAFLLITLGAMT